MLDINDKRRIADAIWILQQYNLFDLIEDNDYITKFDFEYMLSEIKGKCEQSLN